MPVDVVEDAEVLFRRVRLEWVVYRDGTWHMTSNTFNDVGRRPSVDRQKLRESAEQCKAQATDGIAQVIAAEVRSVDQVIHNPLAPAHQQVPYRVDVLARPILENDAEGQPPNPAHAQIETDPGIDSGSRFNKLKEALVRLARAHGWVVPPSAN